MIKKIKLNGDNFFINNRIQSVKKLKGLDLSGPSPDLQMCDRLRKIADNANTSAIQGAKRTPLLGYCGRKPPAALCPMLKAAEVSPGPREPGTSKPVENLTSEIRDPSSSPLRLVACPSLFLDSRVIHPYQEISCSLDLCGPSAEHLRNLLALHDKRRAEDPAREPFMTERQPHFQEH
jgi:hypothetical protein